MGKLSRLRGGLRGSSIRSSRRLLVSWSVIFSKKRFISFLSLDTSPCFFSSKKTIGDPFRLHTAPLLATISVYLSLESVP